MDFVELHARSAFSFLRGASAPEELVSRAADLEMREMAILDRDGVYGSARAHYRGKEKGVRALIGAELTLEDGTVIPVLARTRAGYQNLCRLLTRAHLRHAKGECRCSWAEVEAWSEGLLALSGDEEGPVQEALRRDDKAAALGGMEKLLAFFGRENVAVEIQRHRLRPERRMNQALIELAERFRVPVIASNGPCHALPEGRLLLDAFTSLRHHTTLDQAGLVLSANSQRYLKSRREMRELFADLPYAVENTLRIAERVEFSLENLGYEFPSYPVPADGEALDYLRKVTYEGAERRYAKVTPAVRHQLEHELELIGKLGFPGYFLVVWDLVNYCGKEGILIQGRGSAANSAVCYCLGITNADPVGGELLFERFLSEGRNTWPDIDLDLPSGDQREKVIQEVYRRFAPYGAAMTANVITYRGRSAMREMGKVLGLPVDVISRFSDLFAHGDFPHTIELEEQIRQAGLPSDHPRLPSLLRLYQLAYGLPRHLGQHSGGMVLCSKGLDSIVPLEPASMPGRVVVQWDKDDCEDLGIIKVDLLGLGMMAVLEETIATCAARGPERTMELHRIPPDDPATYAMLCRADTIGVFQIESRAQQATLPRMQPKCFYDIVIETAIIRPGPIVGKLVHPYLNRRSGKEKVDYMDPRLEPVLKRTLGVPLFQEQVLRIAMVMADFTGSEAEELRRALSFHRSEERMIKVMDKLRAAMTGKGVPVETQERIVASIKSFALYGFPESHAISFALLAYASAWLRVHRLAEFTAALLNNQPMGFYSPSTLVRDAKLHGLRVKPVCAVHSEIRCTVVDDTTLRLGFNQLRGVSAASAERIVQARAAAPWRDVEDFLLRCPLPRDERRILAKAGVLNALTSHRRHALWEVERTVEEDLFTQAAASAMTQEEQPEMPLVMMTPAERLQADYQSTSLTVGPHPMALIRDQVPQVWVASRLPSGRHGQRIVVAGMVICRQRPGTAKGHVFISLEDETGIANAFVPSTLFEAQRLVITQEAFLQITGRLQIVENVISVYALKIETLRYETEVGDHSHDFH